VDSSLRQGQFGPGKTVSVTNYRRLIVDGRTFAKLQVRPILLKKIFFVIFFNNYAFMTQYIGVKKKKSRNDFFFSK